MMMPHELASNDVALPPLQNHWVNAHFELNEPRNT